MILLDFSQITVSSLLMTLGKKPNEDDEILKQLIFNRIRLYNLKYKYDFGKMFVCCDSKDNWRKDYYPEYKQNRKEIKEKDALIWNKIHKVTEECIEIIDKYFPQIVLQCDKCEADDIIAVITKEMQHENILILSKDKDYHQLHKFKNIKQISPDVSSKEFVTVDSPRKSLIEHVYKGDSSDNVPNILSGFEGKKHKIYAKLIEETIESKVSFYDVNKETNRPDTKEEYKNNLKRNNLLINFECIPDEIRDKILYVYTDKNENVTKESLYNYFLKYKYIELLRCLQDYY